MTYKNRQFNDGEVLTIDGEEFFGCTFTNCTLVYSGGGLPKFNGCHFATTAEWRFDEAAGRVLTLLSQLHAAGATELIEGTFNNLRGLPDRGVKLN